MKIAFFGREFHKFSSSANFFIEYISQQFDVDLYYLDGGDDEPTVEFIKDRYEAILCWQNEHVAVHYSIHHPNVINISMWDGVASRSDNFFKLISSVKNICFCDALLKRLSGLSPVNSIMFKYYINPKFDHDCKLNNVADHRVTFWERNPDFLCAQDIVNTFKCAINKFHFHGLSTADRILLLDKYPDMHFTFTEINNRCNEMYIYELTKSTIFVSPRRSEGIGMSFIEAMSHGLLVLGNNEPTLSEYLNKNCLFEDIKKINAKSLISNYDSEISMQNIRYKHGFEKYNNDIHNIKNFIAKQNCSSNQLNAFPCLNLADVDNSLLILENYANTYRC